MKTKPDTIIEYGLIFLIIFTPLAFGSVHIWAYTIVEVVVLLLLLTFLLARSALIAHRSSSPAPSPLHGARSTEPRVAPCPLPPAPCSLPLALFLGLIIFQIVPLPATVVKHLSPNTYDLYQQTLGNSIEQGARSTEEGARSYEPRAKGTEPSVAPHSQPLASRPLSLYSQATKTEFLKFFVYVSVFFLIITTMTPLRQIRRLVLTIIFTGTGVAFLE